MERYRSSQMVFLVAQLFGKPLAAENLRMHPNDQHFLIVGTVEDADPPAFRQTARGAPEKIVFQFLGARLLETENLAALRIDAGHDVPDGAVLAGSVHSLKNQQQRIAVGRIVKLLQRAQLLNVFVQEFLILLLRLANGLHNRRPFAEFDLFARPNAKILGIDLHLHAFGVYEHACSSSRGLRMFRHLSNLGSASSQS